MQWNGDTNISSQRYKLEDDWVGERQLRIPTKTINAELAPLPERAVPNINKILPLNHYHHINLEGLGNSECQSTKSGL